MNTFKYVTLVGGPHNGRQLACSTRLAKLHMYGPEDGPTWHNNYYEYRETVVVDAGRSVFELYDSVHT